MYKLRETISREIDYRISYVRLDFINFFLDFAFLDDHFEFLNFKFRLLSTNND